MCNRLYVDGVSNMQTVYPFPVFGFFLVDQNMVAITVGTLMTRGRFRKSSEFQLASAVGLQLALGLSDAFALWVRSPERLLSMYKLAREISSYQGSGFPEHSFGSLVVIACFYFTVKS